MVKRMKIKMIIWVLCRQHCLDLTELIKLNFQQDLQNEVTRLKLEEMVCMCSMCKVYQLSWF